MVLSTYARMMTQCLKGIMIKEFHTDSSVISTLSVTWSSLVVSPMGLWLVFAGEVFLVEDSSYPSLGTSQALA